MFDSNSVDDRKHIDDGNVEDQSSAWGPTNVDGSQMDIWGREVELYKLVTHVTNPDIRFMNIYGCDAIERTGLVKELARFLTVRNLFQDGVYYYNLDRMDAVKDMHVFFKNTIGRYLGNTDILLILDNIDYVEENVPHFRMHLYIIMKKASSLKLIVTKEKEYKKQERLKPVQFCLKPLETPDPLNQGPNKDTQYTDKSSHQHGKRRRTRFNDIID